MSHIEVKITPLLYKQVVVEWSIPHFWGECLFNVYKSPTEYGPWTKLNPAPIDGYFLKDILTEQYTKNEQDFYIVECMASNGKVFQSKVATWDNKRSDWVQIRAKEIARRENLLLRKFTGIDVVIFRRRTFGKRCPECWDSKIEKVIKDHCTCCLGTSYAGGYFPGYVSKFQFDPTHNNNQLAYQGKVEINVIPAWTTFYPEINVFDVILRLPDMRIYRVDAVQVTELQTARVRQIMNLVELSKFDIEYELARKQLPEEFQN